MTIKPPTALAMRGGASLAALLLLLGATGANAQSLASLSSAPLAMAPLPQAMLARPVLARPLPAASQQRPAMTAPAGSRLGAASPGVQCRQAIHVAERAAAIPDQLMAAIARIESGRREADGSINPWPWSINVEGTDHIFETKREAISAVQILQARGIRSIDVGCMQVNLLHHPDAFASLDDAFDPTANAVYAARFLVQLHAQTGAWPTATAWYHSATPELGEEYRRKVMAVWPEELRQPPPDTTHSDLAAAWAATRPAAGGAGSAAAAVPGGMTGNRAGAAKLLPQAPGTVGRALAGYRAMPIPLASRPLVPLSMTASNGHG